MQDWLQVATTSSDRVQRLGVADDIYFDTWSYHYYVYVRYSFSQCLYTTLLPETR